MPQPVYLARRCAAVAAALLLNLSGAAQAAEYPPRKPGLWEVSIEGGRGREHVVQQCIDAKTDALMRDMGDHRREARCSKNETRKEGGKIIVDSVCDMGKTTATSHAEITGDFNSDYRMETRTTYDPPMRGQTNGNAVIHARWTGPCKADQKPGDMIMPGGMKMNILDIQAGRPPGAAGMPRK